MTSLVGTAINIAVTTSLKNSRNISVKKTTALRITIVFLTKLAVYM